MTQHYCFYKILFPFTWLEFVFNESIRRSMSHFSSRINEIKNQEICTSGIKIMSLIVFALTGCFYKKMYGQPLFRIKKKMVGYNPRIVPIATDVFRRSGRSFGNSRKRFKTTQTIGTITIARIASSSIGAIKKFCKRSNENCFQAIGAIGTI